MKGKDYKYLFNKVLSLSFLFLFLFFSLIVKRIWTLAREKKKEKAPFLSAPKNGYTTMDTGHTKMPLFPFLHPVNNWGTSCQGQIQILSAM